jgi:peptidoglycan/xylan/chitin deacetylase (PgdA/CDA1 family)
MKLTALQIAKSSGIIEAISRSHWRQSRLLILCYHGLSLKDEHQWRNMFVTRDFFRRRLEILTRRRYQVLRLDDALAMLRGGSLPPKAVVITFDDGFHDFHQFGFPALREFGFPATVYQTTYYSDHPYPIFNLVLSYLFWRGAGRRLAGAPYGLPGVFELSRDTEHGAMVDAFLEVARQGSYTAAQRNEVAAAVAAELGVDFREIMRLRMLQLMTAAEIAEISAEGIDVQLHTHRHRVPLDEQLFIREINDNRQWLAAATGVEPKHFCYPSGQYRREFWPWLRAKQVASATTCDLGMATRSCDPLLLPRFLDSMRVTDTEFEAWLSGLSSFLPHRRV